MTDGQGRTVDFKQTLIILTSNLGPSALGDLSSSEDTSKTKDAVMDAVKSHFRPEFLNRLDEMVIFDRLGRKNMDGIVDIQLDRLQKRLDDRKITVNLSDDAKTWLANKGYDPVYGARPLKRVIQNELQNKMAELLLSGEVLDGYTIDVSVTDGVLSLSHRDNIEEIHQAA